MSKVAEKNLKQEVKNFLNTLTPQETATVIGLYGDLGAGKTTFTKALASVLGITEIVTSPTFVLEKIYTLKNKKLNKNFLYLVHIDAYRLENSNELKGLGWGTIISDPGNIIVIEWADKVEDILPSYTKKIHFEVVKESSQHDTRDILYEN